MNLNCKTIAYNSANYTLSICENLDTHFSEFVFSTFSGSADVFLNATVDLRNVKNAKFEGDYVVVHCED